MKENFGRKPLIYLITGGDATGENFREKSSEILKLVACAVASEISLIQIREKALPARMLFELARAAAKITGKTKTKLLVNDRADIALAAQADGVHLSARSLSAKIIRENFGARLTIGVSAHSFEEVEKAKNENADFAVFGPVFSSPGKGEPVGIDALRAIGERVKPFPVLALGGVDETNLREVLPVAAGFAAIRFLNDEKNLRRLKRALVNYELQITNDE